MKLHQLKTITSYRHMSFVGREYVNNIITARVRFETETFPSTKLNFPEVKIKQSESIKALL